MKDRKQRIVIFVFVILFFMVQCGRITKAPEHLIGVWKTQDSKYADRAFKIEERTINLRTGEGQFEDYPIIRISIKRGTTGKDDLYTISYNNEGGKTKFSFYYDSTDRGVIRFINQTQIAWKREGK
jgi:hypothetical protein